MAKSPRRQRASKKSAASGTDRAQPPAADVPAVTTCTECNDCPALCCHDLVMPIEKPKTADDIFELKWELQYDTVNCFVRSHRWYRIVKGRCRYLDANNRCTIYERRPHRCREHKPPDCEFFGEFYDTMITTPEELEAYLDRQKQRRRRKQKAR